MNKLALAALATFALGTLTTGCASMGTKRPTGGAQITKTASDGAKDPTSNDVGAFDQRADLGQR